MKNTIRCCISCILPCGALDVIRIVHSNGRVEEISGSIKASDIMKAYPKHVLKKPSSSSSDDGMVPKIVIVPPDAELQRGKIYFLIPLPSTTDKTRSKTSSTTKKKKRDRLDTTNNNNGGGAASSRGRNRQHNHSRSMSDANKNNNTISMSNLLISDQYLSEILSEKLSTQRDRRRGRVGVWRPHLESISESPNDG
ncbi:hypothetical protein J1N35_034047 [Gossypium stocksii]|uniref:Uncharacterized protein n=1 Tax=Gossypium stocksii TaxID=47602 RepID=A0A9D3URC8_9ROSI|nr:hypothetical protein J1N35_034047 [Gossypium stocksii]